MRDTKRRERLERRSLLFLSVQNSTVYTGPRSTPPATDSRLSCLPWVTVVTSREPPGWWKGQVWRPSRLRRACQAAAAAPPAAHRRGWVRAASWAVHRAVSRVWARKSQTSRPAAGRWVSWARAWRAGARAASPLLQRPRHPGEEEAVPPLPLAGLHLGEGEVQGGLAGEGIDLGGEGLRPPVPLHRHLALPADLPGHGEGEGGLAEDLPAADGGGRLHPHHAPLGGGGEEGHLAGGQLPDGQQPAGEVGVRLPGHGGVDQEEGLPGGVDQLKGQVHGIPSFLACPWAVEAPGRPGKICHDCSTNPSVGKG